MKSKISSGIYDEDVENYLYGLDGKELCQAIISNGNMVSTISQFMDGDDKRTEEVLELIKNNYLDVCKTWTDYDDFGYIACDVINNNKPYVAQ
ncbi:hypothetical protein [Abyssisolibacter fermentans]|uniref:hypothetical protein n=1 Tax=Abyssisolibacter fermentans TaxID=1766203 RepID=UPI00082AA3FA|nr:hypothetical protein [Abyssisolibacter fermentans]